LPESLFQEVIDQKERPPLAKNSLNPATSFELCTDCNLIVIKNQVFYCCCSAL